MPLRARVFAAVFAVAAGLAGAAAAQDSGQYSGPYGAVALGLNNVPDSDWDAAGPTSGTYDFDNGLAALGALGYAFGNGLRVEGEFGLRRNDANTVTTLGVSAPADWDSRVLSLMANAVYDFNTGTPVTPYVGLGVGLGNLKNSGPSWGSASSETDFAWQGIVGAAIKLSDALDLTADYRYFDMGEVGISPGLDVDYKSHAFLVGLRWRFGAPAPAPAPVAAPVAAPAPAPAPVAEPAPAPPPAPVRRSFLIFFDWDKSIIRADAQKILEAAAAAAKQGSLVSIQLTGHADRSGPGGYNQRLSVRRAVAAKAALVKLGLSAGSIATIGKGETQPLVATADGVREPRNRRVEIVF